MWLIFWTCGEVHWSFLLFQADESLTVLIILLFWNVSLGGVWFTSLLLKLKKEGKTFWLVLVAAQGPFPPWDKFHPEHFPTRTFSTLNFWTLSTPNFFNPNLLPPRDRGWKMSRGGKFPIVAKVRGGKGPGWRMFGVELVPGWKRSVSLDRYIYSAF